MGPWILLVASSTVTLLGLTSMFILFVFEPSGTIARWCSLSPAAAPIRIVSMEDLQVTVITDAKAMERAWTVRSASNVVTVRGPNWLVALGRGLQQLDRADDAVRLACETLPNGTGIAREIATGLKYVVELTEPVDQPKVMASAPISLTDDDLPFEDVVMEPLGDEEELWTGDDDEDEVWEAPEEEDEDDDTSVERIRAGDTA